MPSIKVESFTFKDPKWEPANKTVPGAEVKLTVSADKLQPGQKVVFEVHDEEGFVATVDPVKSGAAFELDRWKVPNTFAAGKKLHFYAMLREEPSPANGHVTVRKREKSAELEVDGFSVKLDSADAAFVPGLENLEVKFTVTDPAGAVTKARIEIWGEKYPSNQPLHAVTINAAAGQTTWNNWDGTASAGHLTTTPSALITPEFTPYRVRVIVGPDQPSVENADDPAQGKGKVAVSEAPFEVTFQSLLVRLAANLQPAVTNALNTALAVEPRNLNGTYAATGRLPTAAPRAAETGRIRIANKRHNAQGDTLNQGNNGAQHRVVDSYIEGGANSKWNIDSPVYKRPEIPLEIEPRLKSRVALDNQNPHFGQFRAGAVGPLKLDVRAEDVYHAALYANAAVNVHDRYTFKAAHHVKDGRHNAPLSPVRIAYWQQRVVVGVVAPNAQAQIDLTEAYVTGSNELTVWLNRTKLDLAAGDYVETSANRIDLAAGLARQHDVVWVIRNPVAVAATNLVVRWNEFPPGDNCHFHYGGIRGAFPVAGEARARYLRAAFSGNVSALGYGGNPFPYTALVNADPDAVVNLAERVESQAQTAIGNEQGLAGIIFSPSCIGGDSYAVEATAFACPYERSLGFVANRRTPGEAGAAKTWIQGKTGSLTVWRLCTISDSQKMPAIGTAGMAPGMGLTDPIVGGRLHPGDGDGMNVANLNNVTARAFTEWALPVPGAPTRVNDPHLDVNLVNYRNSHNGLGVTLGVTGFRNLANNNQVTNDFVQWDHYRERIPPGVPANRVQLVSNVIAAQPPGTSSQAVCNAADNANTIYNLIPAWSMPPVGPGKADQALNGGVAAIVQYAGTADQHTRWIKGRVILAAYEHLDALTPPVNPPTEMFTVRWPALFQNHWSDTWNMDSVGVAGFCRGDGQSFFAAAPGAGNPDTFEHEMGHSLHLAHFITWGPTNSCWKHHDHAYHQCKMGYNNAPGTAMNAAAPYTVPNVVGPQIQLNTGPRQLLCAKCLLKLRGWKEEVLPCNWPHANVF